MLRWQFSGFLSQVLCLFGFDLKLHKPYVKISNFQEKNWSFKSYTSLLAIFREVSMYKLLAYQISCFQPT